MKMHEFNYLQSILTSLSSSTDMTVFAQGMSAKWSRRCSAFVSHREIEFAHCFLKYKTETDPPARRSSFVITNRKHELFVNISPDNFLVSVCGAKYIINSALQLCTAEVPLSLVPRNIREAMRLVDPDAILGEVIHLTFAMRRVASWDKDGRPVFMEDVQDELLAAMEHMRSVTFDPKMYCHTGGREDDLPCLDGILRFVHRYDLAEVVTIGSLLNHPSINSMLANDGFRNVLKAVLSQHGVTV